MHKEQLLSREKDLLKKIRLPLFSFLFLLFTLQSCVTVHPGEVAFATRYGKLLPGTYTSGRHGTGFFGKRTIVMSTRVVEYSVTDTLPTEDGLEITADMTLLYHLKPDAAQQMYMTFGTNYGKKLVINNFVAESRESTLKYAAKDIINERQALEQDMKSRLDSVMTKYGIVIDELLIRDIDLPSAVQQAIQEKAKAEQSLENTKVDIEKQRLEQAFAIEKDSLNEAYSIQKQKQEAERLLIQANAEKEANTIVNSSLSEMLIKYKALDITTALESSPNSKVIITNGNSPVMLNGIDGSPK